MSNPTASFWFQRFQVFDPVPGRYLFRDWLIPPAREAAQQQFANLSGIALQRAFFQHGFLNPTLSTFGRNTGHSPGNRHDILFWQFPCRTEADAFARHVALTTPVLENDALHIYLGLPWATWIDFGRKNAFGPWGQVAMQEQLRLTRLRLAGIRHALAEIGLRLRVHTVCQHIYWEDMRATWRQLGVSDAWISHCPEQGVARACPPINPDDKADLLPAVDTQFHPWALFAVNVQDPARRIGLEEGKDPATKPVLASFVGAHAPGYLSNVRLRLRALADEPGFVIKVCDKWHFEDVVYQHQIARKDRADHYVIDDSVSSYNQLLSDSVFSLCPSGTGPNTLRLWESLAVGSVPVLLGPAAAMPRGGNLSPIDWERIVLRVPDAQLNQLPDILRAIPMAEIRHRQQLGMAAFAQVAQQRCFQD